MTKTVMVFDELDDDLGPFFLYCKENLEVILNEKNITPNLLDSNKLNELSVQLVTTTLTNFIFGAYSHGGKNCLVRSNNPYVSTTINIDCFKNSFFYTFSCSSGYELGSNLVENGCLCFIGYDNIVSIWSTYLRPFMECANYGLIQFFNGESTFSILSQMKEKYNIEIDSIYEDNFMIASILRENRDALVLHGNDINLTHL